VGAMKVPGEWLDVQLARADLVRGARRRHA
jgi:hypothetical protein